MRYSYEYKPKCIEIYRRGEWPKMPDTVTEQVFQGTIRKWVRIEESCGPEALRHNNTNRVWSPDEKYELVAKAIAGGSLADVDLKEGINSGMLYQWGQKCKIMGYNGLVSIKKEDHQRSPL